MGKDKSKGAAASPAKPDAAAAPVPAKADKNDAKPDGNDEKRKKSKPDAKPDAKPAAKSAEPVADAKTPAVAADVKADAKAKPEKEKKADGPKVVQNLVFMWDAANPPLAALGAIELAAPAVAASIKSIGKEKSANHFKVTQTGDQLTGLSIVRFIARTSDATGTTKLYGDDAVSATHVDTFLELSATVTAASVAGVVKSLNTHLALRTFLVTHHITIADLAVYSAVKKAGAADAHGDAPHFSRWFSYVGSHPALAKATAGAAKTVEKITEQKHQSGSGGSFNIPLLGAEMGKMCTRFPPEPSGYLHIGHAKAALLNNYFAREWKGTLILRFDDTNPGKEKQEYVDNIMADLNTLGVKHDRLTHTSDYFGDCEKYAIQLIKDGLAFCDNTPVEQLRKERMDGVNSKCRGQTVSENLRIFNEMLKGSPEGLTYVMRAKIDMKLNNKCMRDPTLYRCNVATPHHRTGTKYKAYPMYDFACPIVDSLEGVTHCLRTSEYHDRNEQYNWVLNALKLKHHPHIWDYSRLSFVYTLLSKRKLQWFVDNNLVEGWSDPRFPTVQGMIRRGLTVEALREFILSQGASKAITTQEWDKLWTMNKYYLDPIVPRYTAVDRDAKVEFRLSGVTPATVQVPLVPKDASKGSKAVSQAPVIFIEQEDAKLIAKDEEVTLMAWGNAIAKNIVMKDGKVAYIEGVLHLSGNVKSTSKKLTWIAAPAAKDKEELVPCTLMEFDHLITEKSLMKGQDHKQFINPTTKYETAALGEPAMRGLKKGDVIQLQRRGFYRVDAPLAPGKPMVLFFVPDGKSKAMSLLGNKTSAKKA